MEGKVRVLMSLFYFNKGGGDSKKQSLFHGTTNGVLEDYPEIID